MSFKLCNLPALAIEEVIRSMDIREILMLPLLSKRSRNFVRGSISKKSPLGTYFTVKENKLSVKLMKSNLYDERLHGGTYRFKDELLTLRYSDDYVMWEWAGTGEKTLDETPIRNILYYYVEAFKSTKMSIDIDNGIREEFAMEMIGFCRRISFPRVIFRLIHPSSVAFQKLLNEAEENSDLILESVGPMDFDYTLLSGGFKFNILHVENAHWLKIDDFVQCRKVRCYENAPFLSSQESNNLFKKVANMEYRVEQLYLSSKLYKDSDFSEMTKGLCGSEIQLGNDKQELMFRRKDGANIVITLTSWCLHMQRVKRQAKTPILMFYPP